MGEVGAVPLGRGRRAPTGIVSARCSGRRANACIREGGARAPPISSGTTGRRLVAAAHGEKEASASNDESPVLLKLVSRSTGAARSPVARGAGGAGGAIDCGAPCALMRADIIERAA